MLPLALRESPWIKTVKKSVRLEQRLLCFDNLPMKTELYIPLRVVNNVIENWHRSSLSRNLIVRIELTRHFPDDTVIASYDGEFRHEIATAKVFYLLDNLLCRGSNICPVFEC